MKLLLLEQKDNMLQLFHTHFIIVGSLIFIFFIFWNFWLFFEILRILIKFWFWFRQIFTFLVWWFIFRANKCPILYKIFSVFCHSGLKYHFLRRFFTLLIFRTRIIRPLINKILRIFFNFRLKNRIFTFFIIFLNFNLIHIKFSCFDFLI